MTHGDLRQPTPFNSWDIGDLYVHLIDQSVTIAVGLARRTNNDGFSRTDTITRQALEVSANLYGGGYEERYRRIAALAEDAFASVDEKDREYIIGGVALSARAWYDKHVDETVVHTWDLAQAMGFAYQPPVDMVFEVLRTLPEPSRDDVESAWDAALRRSGRDPVHVRRSSHRP